MQWLLACQVRHRLSICLLESISLSLSRARSLARSLSQLTRETAPIMSLSATAHTKAQDAIEWLGHVTRAALTTVGAPTSFRGAILEALARVQADCASQAEEGQGESGEVGLCAV